MSEDVPVYGGSGDDPESDIWIIRIRRRKDSRSGRLKQSDVESLVRSMEQTFVLAGGDDVEISFTPMLGVKEANPQE